MASNVAIVQKVHSLAGRSMKLTVKDVSPTVYGANVAEPQRILNTLKKHIIF